MKNVHKPVFDRIGIGASLACAVHCIVLPLLYSTLPLLGIELLKNWKIEASMVFVSFIAGSWALYHGYKKHHHRVWTLVAFGIGLCAVITGNFMSKEWMEMTLKFLGATAIVVAHIYNLKYCRQCTIHPSKEKKIKTIYTGVKQLP